MSLARSILLIVGIFSLLGCTESNETEVSISEKDFSVRLPGEWSRRLEEDGLCVIFSRSTGREQLTVSLMPSSQRMDTERQLLTFNRVLELRRQAETQAHPPSAITISTPVISEDSGIHAARYTGFQPSSQRRFSCLLFCSSSLVATFYYEALGLPQAEAEQRGKAILDSAKLADR